MGHVGPVWACAHYECGHERRAGGGMVVFCTYGRGRVCPGIDEGFVLAFYRRLIGFMSVDQ